MSLYKGKRLEIEILGSSHDSEMTATVSGMPSVKIDREKLSRFLERRKGGDKCYLTSRRESDIPVFTGIKDGVLGDKFSFSIANNNVEKKDYADLFGKPRPSHADYAWYLKDNVKDFSGGGRFSGRLTAPLCVVGGICKQILEERGIYVLGYVSRIGKVEGTSYKDKPIPMEEAIGVLSKDFPSLSNGEEMEREIMKAKEEGDSVGGRIECIVYGMPGGVGDNLFDGLEGRIASLIYSVPAVKGVEFGLGFGFAERRASEVNDELKYVDGKVKLLSNNNGGINGGISNGEPITVGVAVKPTPSIAKEQRTVDLVNKTNVTVKVGGRHDGCIVPRAIACVESAVAICLVDEIEK